MDFQFIPVAEASVKTLMMSINRVIINPIILFLFACALTYFLYGVAQYFLSPNSEEIRKKSKSHMLWGVIGLFIMVAVFGIMNIILDTLGVKNIKINKNSGDYTVDGTTPPTTNVPNSPNTGQDIFTSSGSLTQTPGIAPSTPQLPASTYTTNPFTKVYIQKPTVCWQAVVTASDSTEYKALQIIRADARAKYIAASGIAPADRLDYPHVYDRKTMYDPSTKLYYVWWDVRGPLGAGTVNDCNLAEVTAPEVLPTPADRSTKPNPLVNSYVSDSTYWRVVDSGVDKDLSKARGKAIRNALIEIARLKGLTSTSTLYDAGALSLEEQYYTQSPPVTGNFDYWIAIQYKK